MSKIKQDISFGSNLRRLRLRSKFTQEQVIAKLQTMGVSISREILSQMERGYYSVRVSTLIALKDIYNVSSYDEFFSNLTINQDGFF